MSNRRYGIQSRTQSSRKGHPFPDVLSYFQEIVTKNPKDHTRQLAVTLLEQLSKSKGLWYVRDQKKKAAEGTIQKLIFFAACTLWVETKRTPSEKALIKPKDIFHSELKATLQKLIALLENPKFGNLQAVRAIRLFIPTNPDVTESAATLLAYARGVYEVLTWGENLFAQTIGVDRSPIVMASGDAGQTMWQAMQIAIGQKCQELFGERMPQLISDVFNTDVVQKDLGMAHLTTKGSIGKLMQFAANKHKIPGVIPKKNPAKAPLNWGGKSRIKIN